MMQHYTISYAIYIYIIFLGGFFCDNIGSLPNSPLINYTSSIAHGLVRLRTCGTM